MNSQDYVILDLGATCHCFYDPIPNRHLTVRIKTIGGFVHGYYKENLMIKIQNIFGAICKLSLQRSVVSDQFSTNLLSLPQLRSSGWDFSLQTLLLSAPDGTQFQAIPFNNLFILHTCNSCSHDVSYRIDHKQHGSPNQMFLTSDHTPSMQLLHNRLAHFSAELIQKSIRRGAHFGAPAETAHIHDKPTLCHGCLAGMAKMPIKHRQPEKSTHCGQLIHSDIKVLRRRAGLSGLRPGRSPRFGS